ncbi:DNA-binding IclR family transcriptional regulator [Streptomyces sp. LBL]|uniref:IclR family transcriptional regulator n=1 Tax=Streptomyces sp. LBL TaxID=2940562 RepID=UPI002476393C|nr:IclR family transcriptional regulator [Streptomyces sp. LBL]MDH6622427.1 DNA-binding IclR family transcriptional regulator [Streptomyces sp. LBL]
MRGRGEPADADGGGGGGVREVKSAARTVQVLEILANGGSEQVRLRELSEKTGVPRSSLYALLQTLVACGWVRTDATNSFYSIGIRALLTGTRYLDTDARLGLAGPVLDRLAEELGETTHFARLDGPDIVYLATRESRHYLRPFSRVGRRLPAQASALGKALLAEQPPAYLERELPPVLPSYTARTISDHAALREHLDAVRKRGYAIDDEEHIEGVVCFGFALRYSSPAEDAISCSVPTVRLSEEHRERIVAAMFQAREELERAHLR